MSSEATAEWLQDVDGEHRRRIRQALAISLAGHLAAVAALSLAPSAEPLLLAPAITVDLVAAIPSPSAAEPAAKPAPEPAPKPVAVPPPAPKVKILPKEAPAATAKPRVEPKPKPEPVIRRPRPREMSYEEAMAQLRQDTGVEEAVAPREVAKAEDAKPEAAAAPAGRSGPRAGQLKDPWTIAVERHIRDFRRDPPEFRRPGLVTTLEVKLAADGRVLGEPKVVSSSGNPYYDDNARRTIVRASPLPEPEAPGWRTVLFVSEE